jgi:hypothetical protein
LDARNYGGRISDGTEQQADDDDDDDDVIFTLDFTFIEPHFKVDICDK